MTLPPVAFIAPPAMPMPAPPVLDDFPGPDPPGAEPPWPVPPFSAAVLPPFPPPSFRPILIEVGKVLCQGLDGLGAKFLLPAPPPTTNRELVLLNGVPLSIPNGPSALAVKEAAWGLARYTAISQVHCIGQCLLHRCGGCDDNHYIHGFPDYAHHMESKHIVIFEEFSAEEFSAGHVVGAGL
ncbi:hypothetical protein Sjap_015272 [Stephania japonica]|uniref:Uncharacterized protein n=1 Tax=Stephania japonica TaxID=461633 RepID=A0AAP0IJK4_9MAGN